MVRFGSDVRHILRRNYYPYDVITQDIFAPLEHGITRTFSEWSRPYYSRYDVPRIIFLDRRTLGWIG